MTADEQLCFDVLIPCFYSANLKHFMAVYTLKISGQVHDGLRGIWASLCAFVVLESIVTWECTFLELKVLTWTHGHRSKLWLDGQNFSYKIHLGL